MNYPLVSVCVQTYQHVSFIASCLDSILMQKTTFPIEIVLGEDESNDGTRRICKQYAKKHPDIIRLFLRSRKDVIYVNGNATGRFNLIENLKASKGKYISLLEGDDYWTDPLKLQKQVDFLETNKKLIACHHWQKIAVKIANKFVEKESPKHGYYPQKTSNIEVVFSNKMRVKSRTIMFRNIIDDDFFPKWFYEVAFGDVPLSFLLGKHGGFGFINKPMAVYRQTEKGLSTKGIEELGNKRFLVQHFKNWIDIWDSSNKHYKYKYNKESVDTVKQFYKTIIANMPLNLVSCFKLLKYNVLERNLPIHRTFTHSLWLSFYYLKFFGYRLKKRLFVL